MEIRVRGLTPDEMSQISEQAAERGMRPTAFAKWLLLGDPRPMNDGELNMLLAAKARAGNMRAIELLLRRTQAPAAQSEPETPAESPFAEVIQLTEHRIDRTT